MIKTPSSFTLEHLSSLKFKELQKLSAQYKVNTRWAKKHELINNLLALKEKNEEENQWKDGSVIINDLKPNDETEVNKRLTFKIDKENKESHLTFDMPQNGKNLLNEVNPRETYDIPPNMSLLGIGSLTDSRATFDISSKEKLIIVDPRATFDVPQTSILLKDEITEEDNVNKCIKNSKPTFEARQENTVNTNLLQNLKKLTFDISLKNGEEKKDSKSQIKTLSIPYARLPRRAKKDEISKHDSTPFKLSSRSINIKKSTRLPVSKNNLIRSPAVSTLKKSTNQQNVKSLTVPQEINVGRSLISTRFEPVEGVTKLIQMKNNDDSYKENKTILRKRHSKPENFLRETSGSNKVNFAAPPQSTIKTLQVVPFKKTPLRKESEKKNGVKRRSVNNTQTPDVTGSIIKKPITATKMPDFSKIHKKQFDQMDSLQDYIRKKEERVRKLFGTPQPGKKAHNRSTPGLQFKFSENEKVIKGTEDFKNVLLLSKKKENSLVQKEAMKIKLPPTKLRSDVKDKNRSHIQGVRTNKRFDLQMKFRNL